MLHNTKISIVLVSNKKPAQKSTVKAVTLAASKKPSTKQQTANKTKVTGKEDFPHFRRNKVSNHPALIVGEQISTKEEYKYRKVMHGEKDGRHVNEKVVPNPNPKDKEPMYIGKRVRHDEKKKFGERLPWKYPKK